MITTAQIRAILKIAAEEYAYHFDESGRPARVAPGMPLTPAHFESMSEEERKRLLAHVSKGIQTYFENARLPDEKAQEYYDQIVAYLMGEKQKKPEVKDVLPPPASEAPTVKMERPIRSNPPQPEKTPPPKIPATRSPYKHLVPNASADWYSAAKVAKRA